MTVPSYLAKAQQHCIELHLKGDWCIQQPIPDFLEENFKKNVHCTRLYLIDTSIGQWDSMLMVFVMQCFHWCKRNDIKLDAQQMPPAVDKLLAVATAVAPYKPKCIDSSSWISNFLSKNNLRNFFLELKKFLIFIGSLCVTFVKYIRGKSNVRKVDILYFIEQVGPKGLGIITLISVLVGMILAYLGSVQLRQLGAQIYVADLVAIGMTREMGALMTGVLLAGRTGAAYAAQLGTMQVNEEIDAIKTMAMSTMEFLVLPRMLALVFIMPLLTIYSDFLGMIGGAVVATGMDISWTQYILQTQGSIDLVDFMCGMIKSVFFAILIGIAGCQAGLQCGRDSTAVGSATTSAVVRAIVYIVITDAAFNILYDKMGI